jgi:6-phosphogluconolactonase
VTLAVVPAAFAHRDKGFVYAASNSPAGNSLLVFSRDSDGGLTPAGSFPTGGDGSGVGLGSGHSVVASSDGCTVLVVNAGSNTVSAVGSRSDGLRLIGSPAPSGGTIPTSVTVHDSLVYVMNAGSGSISGFRLDSRLGLEPIPGSTRSLAASGIGTDSQIQFDRSGRVLIVDERGPGNVIQTFVLRSGGTIASGTTVAADGGGPFGFDVDRWGHVLFSNADLGGGLMRGASSYDVAHDGTLTPNGPPVSSGQAAACWLAVVGGYAFTTNAASGSIGTFAVAHDGSLSLAGTTPITATANPLDESGADGHSLYVLANGLHEIIGYHVADDGALTQVATVPVPGGTVGVGPD